jgi:type I restriction enzyme S subunit
MNDFLSTGIEWIPSIPKSWEIKKVKHCFNISKEKAKQDNPVILKLARDSIQIRDITTNEGQIAESYYDYNPILPGDLLINPMDLYSGANCNVSEIEGVISPAYINLRSKVKLSSKYFDYYFKIQYWTMAMFAHGKGVSFDNRWTINTESVLNYEIPFPSYDMQIQIVNELNKKLSKVDELITNQKYQIDNLNDYKKSLISEKVTKGLDTFVDMKDSGVTWLGRVPKSYVICRLKDLLRIPLFYGSNKSGEKYDDNFPRYIRITDIQDDNLTTEDSSKQSYTHDDAEKYMVQKCDILFARSGATSGKTYMVTQEDTNCVFAGYLINGRFDKNKVNHHFLYYYTKSSIWDMWKNYIFIQSTIQNISAEKYNSFSLTLPPRDEQDAIVAYLDDKTQKLDRLIAIKINKIEELNEYKKTIIYEYVTGKKEVS